MKKKRSGGAGRRAGGDGAEGRGGLLTGATARVTRRRLALEGSSEATLVGGAMLRPTLQAAVRHDGGDAETGFGLELGGGLAFTDPTGRFSAEVSAHGLLTHEDDDFRESGVSGMLLYDPQPHSELGLSLTLSPSWGASAYGADGIWKRTPAPGLLGGGLGDGDVVGPEGRLEGEIGYGMRALGGRAIGTPWVRGGLAEQGGHYRLGYSLDAGRSNVGLEAGQLQDGRDYRLSYGYEVSSGPFLGFHLGAEAIRQESAFESEASHTVGFRADLRW